ncbi:MAG: biopolymer transporter ExbD [Planctomycetota bacterium]|nr:MAG: biopolymer transporter ExbD [Planctomycetota bacterium]
MSGSSSEGGEPDLTPILDMVFQLITFFMLVMNFKAAALDLTLKLPVIGSAMPVDTQGQEELLVLNLSTTGDLTVYGNKVELDGYIAAEAEVSRLAAKRKGEEIEPGGELPTTIVIRSDEASAFKDLYRVIKACQDRGFRKFALKATRPE